MVHGNGGEALIGEAMLLAATRRILEALIKAHRNQDDHAIKTLGNKITNTCAGAWVE